MFKPLKALVHGDAGTRKSWLGASAPGPRLVLDAEKGSHFARRVREDGSTYIPHALVWDPHYALPDGITEDTTVIVKANGLDDLELGYRVLAAGEHPFRSVIVDSLSDFQLREKRRLTEQSGQDVTGQREWGILLDEFIDICQRLMDLCDHPTTPLVAVVVLSGSVESKDGKMRPMVQGALATRLPGYPDLLGYTEVVVNPLDPSEAVGRMHFRNGMGWVAKDRTHFLTEEFPQGYMDSPDIEKILHIMNPPEKQ